MSLFLQFVTVLLLGLLPMVVLGLMHDSGEDGTGCGVVCGEVGRIWDTIRWIRHDLPGCIMYAVAGHCFSTMSVSSLHDPILELPYTVPRTPPHPPFHLSAARRNSTSTRDLSAAPAQVTSRHSFQVIQKQACKETYFQVPDLPCQGIRGPSEYHPGQRHNDTTTWINTLLSVQSVGECVYVRTGRRGTGRRNCSETAKQLEDHPGIVRGSSSFLPYPNERSIPIVSFLCRKYLDRSGEKREHDEVVVEEKCQAIRGRSCNLLALLSWERLAAIRI